MAETVYVCGAKGGAGASTFTFRLASALSALGERTLIFDGDAEFGGALEISGMGGLNVYTLADAAAGACRVKQAILQHPSSPNLYILPSLGCSDGDMHARAVEECKRLFDVILCDGGAAGACNRAIVVSEPYPHSLAYAKRRGAQITDGGLEKCELVVNKVNGGLVFDGAILTPQEFAAVARLPLLGVIPEDLSLPLLKMRADTGRAFNLTAEALLGRSKKVFGTMRAYSGMGGIIKRKMRERI